MKNFSLFALVFLALLASGCDQRGPVTHSQAFNALKAAYQGGNQAALSSLLSENSQTYISKIALAMSRLSESSKLHAAQKLGIEAKTFESISPEEYVELYLELNTSYQKDIVSQAIEKNVVSIAETEQNASYTMANNVKLYFVKEEPYWKFDLERSVR